MNTETNEPSPSRCYRVTEKGIEAVTVPYYGYRRTASIFASLRVARMRVPQKPRVAPRTAVGVVRPEGNDQ